MEAKTKKELSTKQSTSQTTLFFSLLLITILLLPGIVLALSEDDVFSGLAYSLTLTYDSQATPSFSLKNITLISARAHPQILGKTYTVRINSFKGEQLYETSFTTNLEIFFSLPVSKTEIPQKKQSSKTNIDLLLPYYPSAQTASILKDEDVLLTIDLAAFARCNQNNACDGSESILTCPQDCPTTTKKIRFIAGSLTAALVLLSSIVFWFFSLRKKRKTDKKKNN